VSIITNSGMSWGDPVLALPNEPSDTGLWITGQFSDQLSPKGKLQFFKIC
jgi:hypothetical protein